MSYFAAVFRVQVKYSFKRKLTGIFLTGLMVFMSVFSCKPEPAPVAVLSEQEMVKVLIEFYLIEEKVSKVSISRDSLFKIFPQFKNRVFKNLQISDSAFNASWDYYMANPQKLEHIYTAVVDSLSFRAQAASILDSATRKNVLPE